MPFVDVGAATMMDPGIALEPAVEESFKAKKGLTAPRERADNARGKRLGINFVRSCVFYC
eukprot:389750-Rhodomonas_salina.1